MAEQRAFVDYEQGLGDTGQDNVDAIQPISTGEGATETVFRRPSENIRARTEVVRDVVSELLQYRDYGHMLLEYTGGTSIKWEGAAPGAPPLGRITVTGGGLIKISPFLAPKTAQKGSLSIGTAAVDQITYTVAAAAYATHGMNAVTVAHTDGGAATVLNVSITDGPIKRIIVLFDSTNTAHDAATVKTAVDAAIAGNADLIGLITTSTNAVAANAIAALAETRLEGTADDESHVITAADLQTLTTTTPLQTGMGIAVWYRYLIEPAGGDPGDPKVGLAGGRSESSVNRGTSAIPSASLFITDSDPEKIPGAIPVCRVGYGGQLIWADGTRQQAGETVTFASATSVASAALAAHVATLAGLGGAAIVGYGGSGNWVDGSSVTASTVETAIDEVVSDLASNTGAAKVGVNGAGLFTSATVTNVGGGGAGNTADDIAEALDNLDAQAVRRRAYSSVVTDSVRSTGGDIDNAFINSVFSYTDGGTFFLRRGAYLDNAGGTTTNPTALITERHNVLVNGLSTLTTSTASRIFDISSSGFDASGTHIENFFLRVTAATALRYRFARGKHSVHHVKSSAGVIQFFPGVGASQTLDIDDLRITADDDTSTNTTGVVVGDPTLSSTIRGLVRKLDITGVPVAGAGTKYSLFVSQRTGNEALIFEDCVASANYGGFASGGAALSVNANVSPLIFRRCHFSSNIAGVRVASIVSSSSVIFEDCTFQQNSTGQVLDCATGNTDIHFKRCTFISSSSTINNAELHVINSGSPNTIDPSISFEDCYIELKAGDNSTSRRLAFNYSSTANTELGSGPVNFKNVIVRLNYADTGLNANFFMLGSGASGKYASRAYNLTFDLASKQQDSTTTAILLGDDSVTTGGFVDVENLTVINARSPSAGADTAYLISIYRANIRNVWLTGDSGGTEVTFKGLFGLRAYGASVVNARCYYAGTVLKGRIFDLVAAGTAVHNTQMPQIAVQATDNTEGWFARLAANQITFSNNSCYLTNDGAPIGSLVYLDETDFSTITSNVLVVTGDVYAIQSLANSTLNTITGNLFVGDNGGGNYVATDIAGTDNNVGVNISRNLGGGTSSFSINAGSLTTGGNHPG